MKPRYSPEVAEAIARESEALNEKFRSRAAYREAYETAKRDLTKLITEQQELEKKKLSLRKLLQDLASLCESQGDVVEESPEAASLLLRFSLAEETRNVLCSAYPESIAPRQIKTEVAKLGHDLSKYRNPQSAIQTVLARMVASGEADQVQGRGKASYRYRPADSGNVPRTRELSVVETKLKRRTAVKPAAS